MSAFACPWVHLNRPETVPWRSDYYTARQEAATIGKRLFIEFTASWCVQCRYMKREVWSDEAVSRSLEDYVPVQIDIDSHRAIAGEFHVNTIPTVLVMDAKNDRVLKITKVAMTPEKFLEWLGS